MKLTKAQKAGLTRLVLLSEKHAPFTRFTTMFIGQCGARALRTLDGSGLVEIDKYIANNYRYRITPAGRAALENADG